MTVKQFKEIAPDKTFRVVVKEPGQCFRYSCQSGNVTQSDDFEARTIYDWKVVSDLLQVYCW